MTDGLVNRIETAALWAWPPRETAWVDGWLLRAAGGHTRRANSARTLAFTEGADLERALARVAAWYADRALPACFQLTEHAAPAGLDAALAARGYAVRSPSMVLLLDPTRVARPQAAVELVNRPTALVMNALCDPLWAPSTRKARAALFGRIRRPHTFAVATADGEPVAAALGVLDRDLGGIFALRTGHRFRRAGRASAVVRRLAGWLHDLGAGRVYLQVEEANAPARALFAGLGGELAYRYWYRELPPAG